jgi:hypothetical protein
VDGEFVIENALFDFCPTKTNSHGDTIPWHVIYDYDLKKIVGASTVYRSIDVGWFPDPTIVLWIAHLGNRYIVLKEKLWYKTIAADVAKEIKEIDRELGITRVAMTYCDPSMDINTVADVRTVKDIFESHGIPMECSINKRDHFTSAVHTALHEEAGEHLPRIQFIGGHSGCPYLIKTIPQQRYDRKRPMFLADSKDDHGVVALAYFLISAASSETHAVMPVKSKRWLTPKRDSTWILGREAVRDTSHY